MIHCTSSLAVCPLLYLSRGTEPIILLVRLCVQIAERSQTNLALE